MSETISFEVLRERFPSEIINPFGEVLVIPSRLFQRGWESTLESQGHRVYANSFNGESCFLVRVDKAEPRNVAYAKPENVSMDTKPSKAKEDRWKRWTTKETQRLQDMLRQGLGVDEIAEALERTRFSVERKIQRLRKKGFNLPELESGVPITRPSVTPNPVTAEDHVVKELLAAASELYPRYRHACRFLLLETTRMLEHEK